MPNNIEEKVKLLPTNPGVYIMYNEDGVIIYVGKAKNLKNRVTQYFRNGFKTEKVAKMVMNITDFRYIITNSEIEALLLENNLIKKYQPKYNILLKDDKGYPYIKINVKEKYPCLKVTREIKDDDAKYFGPFMCGVNVADIKDIIGKAFKIRNCSYNLDDGRKRKECLNYHLGLCLSPCSGKCTEQQYKEEIDKIINFLNGNDSEVEGILKDKMMSLSQEEKFEEAIKLREKIKMLETIRSRRHRVLSYDENLDVIVISSNGMFSALSLIIIRNGLIVGEKNFQVETLAATDDERIVSFISQYYVPGRELPGEILLQHDSIDINLINAFLAGVSKKKVEITVPKVGEKRNLIVMALKNAEEYLHKGISKIEHKDDMTILACKRLKEILNLKNFPHRMECYDISHISGTDKVGSMVVFTNGEPDKKEYRKFKIKTVEGNNDFESLKEVLARRLQRLKESDEKFPKPDLIVIDGGKGQLSSVFSIFGDYINSIDLISLAEGNEEIYTVGDLTPIVLERSDYALRLVEHLRDEAHRFAITFNRDLRGKRGLTSILSEIDGIGKEKREALLKAFDDIYTIKKASKEQLMKVDGIGEKQAQKIIDYFAKI